MEEINLINELNDLEISSVNIEDCCCNNDGFNEVERVAHFQYHNGEKKDFILFNQKWINGNIVVPYKKLKELNDVWDRGGELDIIDFIVDLHNDNKADVQDALFGAMRLSQLNDWDGWQDKVYWTLKERLLEDLGLVRDGFGHWTYK